MSGRHITNQQEKLYMSLKATGATQKVASVKSGFCERSGRNIEKGKHRSDRKHDWRTRKDPLTGVWEADIAPLLTKEPLLSPITILEYLQNKYQEKYPDSIHRTLQRRIKRWRALQGPEQEVIFRQVHTPGRQGISDFTQLKDVIVTILSQPFEHLLYHFRLSCSGWSHVKIITGGESFTALAEGLQEALWRLGGCPLEHRTDSLSAAFKNLSKDEQKDITQRYQELCKHYNMLATRNNRGVSHENGSIESPHGHIKRRISQALLLRGTSDFKSVAEYQNWLNEVVHQHNRRNAKNVEMERKQLQPLPQRQTIDFTETTAKVTTSSIITVKSCTYSVPSRLIGECLRVHLYHDRLECYLGATSVITLARVRLKGRKRGYLIDYHHVIHSLVKKPQAFRFSMFKNEILPNDTYRRIWDYTETCIRGKNACKFIVNLLALAANYDCEQQLGIEVLAQFERGEIPDLTQLQKNFSNREISLPEITVKQHPLENYDLLLDSRWEVSYGTC